MKNIYNAICKIIVKEKLLNSEKNHGYVFDATDLTFEEMKALLA